VTSSFTKLVSQLSIRVYALCCPRCFILLSLVSTGKDVTETTPRILCNLGTNTVACRMNFAGRGNKKGMAELKILDVVNWYESPSF